MSIFKFHKLSLDVNSNKNNPKSNDIAFNTNDYKGAKLIVTLLHDDDPIDLSGSSVKASFGKPDGTVVFQNCSVVSATSGKIEVILDSQVLATEGKVRTEFNIYQADNTTVNSYPFYFMVVDSVMSDDALESTNEMPAIQKAIEAGEKLIGIDIDILVNYAEEVQEIQDEIEILKKGRVSVLSFEAKGDRLTDDTTAIQAAIDYAYQNGFSVWFPKGIYRSKNLIFKTKIIGTNATILFDEGYSFKNYETDGSKRYEIEKVEGVTFESDKTSYWNSIQAGAAYDAAVTNVDVKRKYGQRVYIGNKTSTPNNICSTVSSEKLAGTGFWSKDYSQWMNLGSVDFSDIDASYWAITNKEDTNKITSLEGVEFVNCNFIGWSIGITIYGAYNSAFKNTKFIRCKIGIDSQDGGYLAGSLWDANSKVTTLTVEKIWFEDISYFGIYGFSLLQSKIKDVIMQPCKVGIVLYHAADNDIEQNYFEVGHSFVHFGTNNAFNNRLQRNYCNLDYTTYQAHMRYGVSNSVSGCKGQNSVFAHAAIVNCDFDSSCDVEGDQWFFHPNGNSVDRNKVKTCVFVTTGTGDLTGANDIGITTTVKKSTRYDNSLPSVTTSQQGIYFNGNEDVISVEILTTETKISRLSYYNPTTDGDSDVMFIDEKNIASYNYVRKDIRESGAKYAFRVSFTDGYKAT